MIGLEYILSTFKINPSQLARDLEISRYTVNDWLKGRRKIPKARIPQLVDYFQFPETYFQEELTNKQKLEVQRAYFDRNATIQEIEREVVDPDGNVYTISESYSEEQQISEMLYQKQLIEELIENVQALIKVENDPFGYNQKMIESLVGLMNSKDSRKLAVLKNLMDYLLFRDYEFGFMYMDEKLVKKMDEIMKLY